MNKSLSFDVEQITRLETGPLNILYSNFFLIE